MHIPFINMQLAVEQECTPAGGGGGEEHLKKWHGVSLKRELGKEGNSACKEPFSSPWGRFGFVGASLQTYSSRGFPPVSKDTADHGGAPRKPCRLNKVFFLCGFC